jgi:hypothetical protein
MEEKKTKAGFWSEYFCSLSNHPLRTVIATFIVVDGLAGVADIIFGRRSE